MKAALPDNEEARLSALVELDVLDTEPEEVFDRITRLAAQIMEVPVALVSLVDRDRQWFKSKVGVDVNETSRDIAFCSHAVLEDEILNVPDANLDPRFADNPLVTAEGGFRFYAGAPLILRDGIRIGTLCTIDTEPREYSELQLQALRDLAAIVVDELRLRQSVKDLGEASRDLKGSVMKLERANQALENFAYMASHDLRAPMNKLVNLADIAVFDTDGELCDIVQPMRAAAVHLEGLIKGYGRLAGLEQGHLEERLVSELIDSAYLDLGREIEIDLREDASVTCDPVLMTQVILNLLENVTKYGSGDGVVIDVSDNEDAVVISVSNPVAETFKVDRSVFAPFRRLEADGDGTGLGLAIVERIAHLHGGSVSARCSDNTFTVEFSLTGQSCQ